MIRKQRNMFDITPELFLCSVRFRTYRNKFYLYPDAVITSVQYLLKVIFVTWIQV
jgi:hypothetical protein